MPVTVLGLGPMGRALAGAFVRAGLSTTVWNRTPGRPVDRGAITARTPGEAVAASELIVVCVVNYDAADEILRPAAAALEGRTVVNLTADTPARARETAGWAAGHRIGYLDGAIMTPAATIGTAAAAVLHSGPRDLFERHRPALELLGGTHTHVGDEIGRAAAFDIALLDVFWTAMAGYAHALALARAEGITAAELAPFAAGIGEILPPIFREAAPFTDRGVYPGDDNPITSAASSMAHIVHTAEAHGLDASVMRAAAAQARQVIDNGHGGDGFLRITDLLSAATSTA